MTLPTKGKLSLPASIYLPLSPRNDYPAKILASECWTAKNSGEMEQPTILNQHDEEVRTLKRSFTHSTLTKYSKIEGLGRNCYHHSICTPYPPPHSVIGKKPVAIKTPVIKLD